MRKILLLLIPLFILSLASSEITNPKAVSSLSLDFSEEGSLIVSGNSKEVSTDLYSFPRDDYYYTLNNVKTDPLATLSSNKEYYTYKWSRPKSGSLSYTYSTDIDSQFGIKAVRSKVAFPYTSIPEELIIYTQPTAKADSDNSAIKRKANELAAGETDAYKVLYKLAKYSHDNLVYDINYLGKIEQASIVLEDKRGVCVEYANLFMSMARSLGIPVRYVSGYAYGNVYGAEFSPHAWAEAWLPGVGWVPFDPTFGEYGWVDPTHIRSQFSVEPEVNSIRYQWSSGTVSAEAPNLSISYSNEEEALPQYVTTQSWLQEPEVAPGSYNIIWMEITNNMNYYLAPEAYLAKAPKLLTTNQQSVLLTPFGSTQVSWIIQIPDDLEENFVYTYAIEGALLFGQSESLKLTVDPRSTTTLSKSEVETLLEDKTITPVESKADILVDTYFPKEAYAGEHYTISVEVQNKGTAPVENLQVCVNQAKELCQLSFLGIGDVIKQTFTIYSEDPGVEYVAVSVTSSEIDPSTQVLEITIKEKTIIRKIIRFLMDIGQAIRG